jgi:cytoskeletal protein CcmA (bactofilin family)
MVIGKNVVMKADLKFHSLLRIEGTVEGKVFAPPDAGLVLCSSATFVGDISGLGVVYIDGTVRGNIFVEHLGVGPNANIFGSVFAQRLEVAEHATIQGQAHIGESIQIPTAYVKKAEQPLVEDEPDTDDESTASPNVK